MILFMILACGQAEKDTSDTEQTGTEQTVVNSDPTDTSSLTKMSECETVTNSDGDEQDLSGATSYFLGSFSIDGTSVSGTETWALLSNDTWAATPDGGDCVVVWNVSGSTTDPVSCGACDLGLTLMANVDEGLTTCPQGLWSDDSTQQLAYDVLRASDGTATFYFANSGNTLASGTHSGDNVVYTSDGECVYF